MATFYLRRCHPVMGNQILRDMAFGFYPTAEAAASELTDRAIDGERYDVVPADKIPGHKGRADRCVVPITARRKARA